MHSAQEPTFFQALCADGAEGTVRQLLHVQKPADFSSRVIQSALQLIVYGLNHLRPAWHTKPDALRMLIMWSHCSV